MILCLAQNRRGGDSLRRKFVGVVHSYTISGVFVETERTKMSSAHNKPNSIDGVTVLQVQVNDRRMPKKMRGQLVASVGRADMNEYYETTRVYVSPKNESLMDQIQSRRQKPSVTFKKLVIAELREAGYNGKVRYSRYAGCKMCPCSPGFVLESSLGDAPCDVWLTVG